ncbi:MAG: hypothetical protein JWO79_2771 [Actinomycetia bacterium]|nr:hypothetical protein [Actinomycetes bacterium]
MRRKKLVIGLAAAATIVVGGSLAASTSSASAGQVPCWVSGGGNSATAGCYSGGFQTWRVAADCVDTSNVRWPKIVDTQRGAWTTGDGQETVACGPGLRADGRLELR